MKVKRNKEGSLYVPGTDEEILERIMFGVRWTDCCLSAEEAILRAECPGCLLTEHCDRYLAYVKPYKEE